MTSPGNALAAIQAPGKGHTKARVYTPPLPENCDTTRDDGCLCGCGLNPDTSWGFDCIEFLEKILGWVLIPYQKWLYIHALERLPGSIEFRYRTIIILIARQNGKTQWLKGLGLWKLFVDGAEEVLITAQNLDLAEKTLAQAVADVQSRKLTRKEFRRYSTTNGKNRMILWPVPGSKTPRHWGTTPSTRPVAGRCRSTWRCSTSFGCTTTTTRGTRSPRRRGPVSVPERGGLERGGSQFGGAARLPGPGDGEDPGRRHCRDSDRHV